MYPHLLPTFQRPCFSKYVGPIARVCTGRQVGHFTWHIMTVWTVFLVPRLLHSEHSFFGTYRTDYPLASWSYLQKQSCRSNSPDPSQFFSLGEKYVSEPESQSFSLDIKMQFSLGLSKMFLKDLYMLFHVQLTDLIFIVILPPSSFIRHTRTARVARV